MVTIIIYMVIAMYALLTGLAAIVQWRENGPQLHTCLFVINSSFMLGALFIPSWTIVILIFTFVMVHILAVVQGLRLNGLLRYSHHIVRFIFHCLVIFLVYTFM